MTIETYDITTGKIAQTGTNLDIGDIITNQHAPIPLVFRCLLDGMTALSIQLVEPGTASYSIFTNQSFIPDIMPGHAGFTALTTTPATIPISNGVSNYVWLDVESSTVPGPAKGILKLSYS